MTQLMFENMALMSPKQLSSTFKMSVENSFQKLLHFEDSRVRFHGLLYPNVIFEKVMNP